MEGSMMGSGGGGPAPFLVKTYEMVDDSYTDEIVSWSDTNNSFIVWNPTEFARLLLRNYFKHNNFSSFIRQLNTYGFRKIHNERWEFANEDFMKDQIHLLKNIHRKKPIHNHNHSLVDPERSAFEEEIEKLSHEKITIQSNISTLKKHTSATKLHVEYLQQRLDGMEKRQKKLLTLFKKALNNPKFVEHISQKIDSINFNLLGYNKKRRFPQVGFLQHVENDNNFGKVEVGNTNIFHEDFSNKLNLISTSSNEGGESQHNKMLFDMDSCLLQGGKLESKSEESDCDNIDCQEIGKSVESRFHANDNECGGRVSLNRNLDIEVTTSPSNNQGISGSAAPVRDRVNDLFWSQFFTE